MVMRDAIAAKKRHIARDVDLAVNRYEVDATTLPELQDALVRLDVANRAEAIARTQDVKCHLLEELSDRGQSI